jgi:hypothetical protein
MAIQNEDGILKPDYIVGAISLSYVINVFIWCVYTLQKNRKDLEKEEVAAEIGNLYKFITHYKTAGLFYFPYIMLRCFVFIMISSLFCEYYVFACMALMQLNVFCIIWYFQYEPHTGLARKLHEGCHECFNMIVAYHLVIFSNGFYPMQ